MTNRELLARLETIHSLVDKHPDTDKLVQIQNELSQLHSELYTKIQADDRDGQS